MRAGDEPVADLIATARIEKRRTGLQNPEVSDTTKAQCIFQCRSQKNFLISATHK